MLIEQVRKLQGLAISRSQAEDRAAFVRIVDQKEIKILDTLFPPKRPRNAAFRITHPTFVTTTWADPSHNPGFDPRAAQAQQLRDRIDPPQRPRGPPSDCEDGVDATHEANIDAKHDEVAAAFTSKCHKWFHMRCSEKCVKDTQRTTHPSIFQLLAREAAMPGKLHPL